MREFYSINQLLNADEGEGVKKSKNFAEIISECSLTAVAGVEIVALAVRRRRGFVHPPLFLLLSKSNERDSHYNCAAVCATTAAEESARPLLNPDEAAAAAVICNGFLRRDVCCEQNFYGGDVKASSEPDVPSSSFLPRERFPVGNDDDDGQPRSPIRSLIFESLLRRVRSMVTLRR